MPVSERRLAAIMFVDMVGYTALGQRNESLSLALVVEQRKLIRPILRRHRGREIKTIGDAFLVEFANTLDAVRCGYDIQRASREFNFSRPSDRRLMLRIGLHLGDVEKSKGDILGDAVNVASRIQPLAADGCICLTQQVYDQVANKFELPLQTIGKKKLKNLAEPIEVYRVVMPWETEPTLSDELNPRRVAVLPFANMSPDPEDEYFADGMTEELISTMSKIGELSVISRTSIMQYKDKPKPIGEIGRELNAGTILEGSVRKAGNHVRITIQMVEASKDKHLWAESYDRELRDIFAIQSEVAQRVAAALRVQLLSSEKKDIKRKPTASVEAYQLYLKGRYHFNLRLKEEFDEALRYFNAAIKLDPRCAIALAGISDCYHFCSHRGWLKPEEAFPAMRDCANRAIEIDPRLAEAHVALGAVYFHYDWRWRDAERELIRASELKPSYELADEMRSYLLAILGRAEESRQLAKRGAELSPHSLSIWIHSGFDQGGAMRPTEKIEEGIARLEKMVETNPEYPPAHESLGFAYYRNSRTAEAVAEMRKAVTLSKDDTALKAGLAFLLALAGQRDEATSILKTLQLSSRTTYVSNVQMACILYGLGRRDEAFDNLETAYKRREIDLPDIRMIPEMSELRADPRWTSIENRMGLRDM